ncbi:DUF2254 domain-containing protein [Jeotgalibacillus haloalkalitolerans]|uniref:DUF2254 domain-containing protein n=1 Tax=Jeotgalibacillus haloalkalitolerans TaxID=3104292 RepID=A0ABU5KK88_9BACL|nr:DUF2254 domain-containing protein [Jeotgalibacillus sp. HH7-29]MDZ5711135.1 DUF2254 domain-containing protein [Jeotgalibacillus sp. HH7-29]
MKKQWINLKDKVWLRPLGYSLLAVLLAAVVGFVDINYGPGISGLPAIFYTEVELAQAILTALITALLTMTTFTFSTIMVVLTTYASQYSPKTIKNFITDPLTLRVLGIFMGGFIYSTLSMLFMRDSLSQDPVIAGVVGVLIAILCLVFFAIFIHHVANDIQASRLIERLAGDTDDVTDYYFKLMQKQNVSLEHQGENWNSGETFYQVQAQSYGYVQYIDLDQLGKKAAEHGVMIEVNVPIGEYVHKATPLLTVYVQPERLPEVRDLPLTQSFMIGNERDVRQDPVFALQKMVEVALRAISPGINDPNTANDSIRHIGRLLGNMAQFPVRPILITDDDGKGLVKINLPSFQDILYKTFFQLRHYGKEDVSVLTAMLEAIAFAGESAPRQHLGSLRDIAEYVVEKADLDKMPAMDREWINQKLQAVERITER